MQIENANRSSIDQAYIQKRKFFERGETLDISFREKQLRRLKEVIQNNEKRIYDSLSKDLGKPEMEAYGSEIGIVYRELDLMLKNLRKWAAPSRKKTPLMLKPSSSHVFYEPKGIVLIIGPWNYPFQLMMAPLMGAIAAGNAVILKPSERAPHTARLIQEIIESTFSNDYVSVLQGEGEKVIPPLFEDHNIDHVLFTGSTKVGRKIAGMAASSLTSTTLELGGKSPAIIDQDVNIKLACKRIVWSKYFNTGQTCLAPDYVMVHESRREEFIKYAQHYIQKFYGIDAEHSGNYGRLVDRDHGEYIVSLLKGQDVIYGGNYNLEKRYFEPTLVLNPSMDDQIMQEEIFGPILPVLDWDDKDQLLQTLRVNRYPLACYIYTERKEFEDFILKNFQFGTGCLNDSVIHIANSNLPFGGVRESGSGRYRGGASFFTFSNEKSFMRSSSWIDPAIRYPEYSDRKLKWVRYLMQM